VRASPYYEIYQFAERDAAVLGRITAEQLAELETEIAALHAEAERQVAEAAELFGSVPF